MLDFLFFQASAATIIAFNLGRALVTLYTCFVTVTGLKSRVRMVGSKLEMFFSFFFH